MAATAPGRGPVSGKMTPGTCPVYPGIQFLGDLTVAPEGPAIAARLAAGGTRAEVPLGGTATGPCRTSGYTILPSGPGTAHFTPLPTGIKPLDDIGVLECTATVYITHPVHGCVGVSEGVYTVLGGRSGTCGWCGTYLRRMCGQWWAAGTWTGDPRDLACPAPGALFGRHAPEPDVLQDIPSPPRGSGKVTCCGHHRERCLRGRHQWATWTGYDGVLQRTPDTLYCHPCGGVCTAGEPR